MTEKVYNIGVENTMEIIGGKWKPIILCHLRHQTMRTGELRRAIPQITQNVNATTARTRRRRYHHTADL